MKTKEGEAINACYSQILTHFHRKYLPQNYHQRTHLPKLKTSLKMDNHSKSLILNDKYLDWPELKDSSLLSIFPNPILDQNAKSSTFNLTCQYEYLSGISDDLNKKSQLQHLQMKLDEKKATFLSNLQKKSLVSEINEGKPNIRLQYVVNKLQNQLETSKSNSISAYEALSPNNLSQYINQPYQQDVDQGFNAGSFRHKKSNGQAKQNIREMKSIRKKAKNNTVFYGDEVNDRLSKMRIKANHSKLIELKEYRKN